MAVITLTQTDHRRSIEASAGDEILIRLPENPTTGYRWHIERAEGAIELEGDSFDLDPDPQIGSGGMREFRFRVSSASRGRIALKHWQEWEGDPSVTDRYEIDVLPA